jgi:hypothetical protein
LNSTLGISLSGLFVELNSLKLKLVDLGTDFGKPDIVGKTANLCTGTMLPEDIVHALDQRVHRRNDLNVIDGLAGLVVGHLTLIE